MATTAPTPISTAPTVPTSTDPEATFDAQYEAFNAWEKTELVPGINALAANVYGNAQAAALDAAATAADRAQTGLDAASVAADALALASLDALWLGAAASDPATGKAGAPLVAGNAYVNSSTGDLRAYNGSAWVQGLSAVAGVTSVNGMAGAVTGIATTAALAAKQDSLVSGANIKTINSQSLLGSGNLSVTPGFSNLILLTANGTWTVPAGVLKIKLYVVGGGGGPANSGAYEGGWSGALCIKYLSVTPGSTAGVTIGAGAGVNASGGQSTFVYGGVTYAAAGGNTGASGIASTASNGDINIPSVPGGPANIYGNEGGSGGNTPYFGGGACSGSSKPGQNATFYGGGGACHPSAGNGSGYQGVVMIEY